MSTQAASPLRVLVADDQELIRTGLLAVLAAAVGVTSVGEAADGEEAIRLTAQLAPDVVLMDIRMPGTDGIQATRRITQTSSTKIVILTTFDQDDHVAAALAAGAAGFLPKDTPPEQIVTAIQLIATDDLLVAPGATRRLAETWAARQHSPSDGAPLHRLTARETEILQLVGHGLDNDQIATRLVLSESTVKTHLKRVMSKLGLRSRAQAVVAAYEGGVITPRRHQHDGE